MQYHGAFIGIDYRGTSSRLSGCIADSNNWRAVLGSVCAGSIALQEERATKANVVELLTALAKECPAGSQHFGIATFSGHGTFRTGSTDPSETDRRDEALCCYDFLQGGLLWDNELAKIIAHSQLLLITDCCHSHTLTRSVVVDSPLSAAPRSIPFADITEGLLPCEVAKLCEGADANRAAARAVRDASGAIPGVIHLAGCLDHEYSYDTPQGGALTIAALSAYRQFGEGANYQQWIDLIRMKLPTRQYPQHPQLTATAQDMRRILPGKEPAPAEPAPIPPTSTGLLTLGGKTYDVTPRGE